MSKRLGMKEFWTITNYIQLWRITNYIQLWRITKYNRYMEDLYSNYIQTTCHYAVDFNYLVS